MLFDELRQKPKRVRSRYAFWLAVFSTSIIAVIWVVTLTISWNSKAWFQGWSDDNADSSGALSRFLDEARENLSDDASEAAVTGDTSTSGDIATSTGESATSTGSEATVGQPVQLATSSAERDEKTE